MNVARWIASGFFALIISIGSVSANTITFNSDTTIDFLDITIDLSDGVLVTDQHGDPSWKQNDGVYHQIVTDAGWTINQTISGAGLGGVIYIRPSDIFGQMGYNYINDWEFILPDAGQASCGYVLGQAYGQWQGVIPTVTNLGLLVTNITWSISAPVVALDAAPDSAPVPDTGTTLVLVGIGVLALALLRSRRVRV